MIQAFPQLGDPGFIDYLTPEIVLVGVEEFEQSCVLFLGCQASGSTLSSNSVWVSEISICRALALAKALTA